VHGLANGVVEDDPCDVFLFFLFISQFLALYLYFYIYVLLRRHLTLPLKR
jgi:hypothetical protein